MTEIDRIRKIIADNKIEAVAGVGGRKRFCTARAQESLKEFIRL
jgi:hydrogenase maturation factor HypF (carbamoyltransferase family)